MSSSKRKRAAKNAMELANEKTDQEFIHEFLSPTAAWDSWKHPRSGKVYSLSLVGAPGMSKEDLKACYGLIEHTSRADYDASSMKWRPRNKMAEMKSPELRYLLVKEPADRDDARQGDKVVGFASMMPTYEGGEPVVYCYEIHLTDDMYTPVEPD